MARETARDELAQQLVALFRDNGFDGTSIGAIAHATGLGRPSLYHHFPGGKSEMAEAALAAAEARASSSFLSPLSDASLAPADRVDAMLRGLDAFYRGGRDACLLNALAFGDERGRVADRLERAADAWIGAMAAVARDAGASETSASERARDAFVRVEGALVAARALRDPSIFAAQLRAVRATLLAGAAGTDGVDREQRAR